MTVQTLPALVSTTADRARGDRRRSWGRRASDRFPDWTSTDRRKDAASADRRAEPPRARRLAECLDDLPAPTGPLPHAMRASAAERSFTSGNGFLTGQIIDRSI